jgi:hypothetical protein
VLPVLRRATAAENCVKSLWLLPKPIFWEATGPGSRYKYLISLARQSE